jgi:hypothetical protein
VLTAGYLESLAHRVGRRKVAGSHERGRVTRTYTPGGGNSLSITKPVMLQQRDAMARTNLTDEDEGKAVVNSVGDKIGMVKEVRGNSTHVNPDPGITDTISSKLGWSDASEDDYELHNDQVKTVTDKEVRLKE